MPILAPIKLFTFFALTLCPIKMRNTFGGRYVDISSFCDLELDKRLISHLHPSCTVRYYIKVVEKLGLCGVIVTNYMQVIHQTLISCFGRKLKISALLLPSRWENNCPSKLMTRGRENIYQNWYQIWPCNTTGVLTWVLTRWYQPGN